MSQAAPAVAAVATLASHPLTEAQAGLWFGQQLDALNPLYNTAHYFRLDGVLDVAAFRRAVAQAVSEADGLAVRVLDDPEGPRQVIDPARRPALEWLDLSHEPDPDAAALAWMRQEVEQPRHPATEPLARQVLLQTSPTRHYWYQRIHHLAIDGYGTTLLDTRVTRLYAALRDGKADTGPVLTPYSTLLDDEAAYLGSPKQAKDRAYWHERFEEPPTVPTLGEGIPISAHRFLHAETALPASASAALQAVAERTDITWPDIVTALCGAYLCRHTAGDSSVVGVPYMGRLGRPCAGVPAMLMNILPLVVTPDEHQPLDDMLDRVARDLRQARRHGRYRHEQLRRELGLLGGKRRLYGPLINVLPFDAHALDFPGLTAQREVLATGPVDDLTLTLRAAPDGSGLRLAIDGNPHLYTAHDIETHTTRLAHFLTQALTANTLAEVPTLTPDEHTHWVRTVNATDYPLAPDTLVAGFARTFAARPNAPALVFGERTLSYAELERASAALAHQLLAQGVQPGDRVAVALPRSLELVVGLFGILRAGAAYLPLDPSHPPARLAELLADATPSAVLVPAVDAPTLPATPPQLVVDVDAVVPTNAAPLPQPTPQDVAYVLYTSGSTGKPKAVVIEHDAIHNRLTWMAAHYGIGADERILQKTPTTFDVSVWEFFLPALCGATLVIAPPEAHKDPAQLAALMRQHDITTLHFVPSMLAAFLAEPAAAGLQPRRVFCSGEALAASLRDRFHLLLQAELHNLYGPTEAAVDVSYWPASADDHAQPVPIGFPVWNTQLYILDALQRPVPPGVTGELFLAGRQLARGYLGQPELTAERFVPNPFGPAGSRMYATGDLARWRPDGAVLYEGRRDHQVKIRGQRIELGEIETALAAMPEIQAAAVLVREDREGDPRLVAYVAGPELPTDDAMRAWLAARLPDAMLPGAYLRLPHLPVTRNGKLDRAALPAPQYTGSAGRAPTTPSEQMLAQLFADALGLAGLPSADDDFFGLGGHSLLAARVMLGVRQVWGHEVGLGALFERPTVARLAAWLDSLEADSTAPASQAGLRPVITLAEGPAERPALFCVHPAGGLSWCYGTLARSLGPARTVHGLQAPTLDADYPTPASLSDLAATYVDTLLALQPHGPYHLLGWSVGGIIAQAMAVELRRRGLPVGVLALLDAYPTDCWRDRPDPGENAALKALLLIAGHDPLSLVDVPLTRSAVIAFLRRTGHPLGEMDDHALAGILRVIHDNNQLVREHFHARYDGEVLYFYAALDHTDTTLEPGLWAPYVDRLDVRDVPSLHAHLTGAPAIRHIAPALSQALLACDAALTTPASARAGKA